MPSNPARERTSPIPEFTLLALLLGCVLTVIFSAANVFLGLRIGINFATSIPAAIISMAVLRALGQSGILQNNIVQTIASAAGTLASVIYVLPSLVIVGWWQGFPFITSFAVCASGGLLGIMFSIPLRRLLVVQSALPFPEGQAAAEVLKVGCGETEGGIGEARASFAAILWGTAFSAGFALLAAMRFVASETAAWFRVVGGSTGVSFSFSFALLGVGHLIGISAGLAALAGLVIAFGIATPALSAFQGTGGTAMEAAMATWTGEVRFIGAGTIGVAALWAFLGLLPPIFRGMRAVLKDRGRMAETALPRREDRDLAPRAILAITALLTVPIAIAIASFVADGSGIGGKWPIVLLCTACVLVTGWFVTAVCGYMAGLVGSSSSPISGVGILAVIGISLILAFGFRTSDPSNDSRLVALALFTTAFVIAAASIANDNLQDLKTGQLVGATPWKQQVALMVGVIAGAVTIPLVLGLLAETYGFGESSPEHPNPLPAPQATLIAALAKGTLMGSLDWRLIGIGALIGIAAIVADHRLRARGRPGLPPLAVGIGIYLPMFLTLPIVVGAVLGHVWSRRNPEAVTRRIAVLMASGLIVGESLFGVLLAIPIAITGNPAPIALAGTGFGDAPLWIAAAVFPALLYLCYRLVGSLGKRARATGYDGHISKDPS